MGDVCWQFFSNEVVKSICRPFYQGCIDCWFYSSLCEIEVRNLVETLKDRIYTGRTFDCVTLQAHLGVIFYELLQILAPITPLLVEEVWDHVPAALRDASIHPSQAAWTALSATSAAKSKALDSALDRLTEIGDAVKIAQERLRAKKKIGSGLETAVTLVMSPDAIFEFNGSRSLGLTSECALIEDKGRNESEFDCWLARVLERN